MNETLISNVVNFLNIIFFSFTVLAIFSKSLIVKFFITNLSKFSQGKFSKGKNSVILGISNLNIINLFFLKSNGTFLRHFSKIFFIKYSFSLKSSKYISNENIFSNFLIISIVINKLKIKLKMVQV